MSTPPPPTLGWKRSALIVLLVFGGIWGGLKWAEKQFAQLDFRDDEGCVGYEFHFYRAFSPLDKIFQLRDRPSFIRVIEKKTGRLIGETGVYWIMSAPKTICPEFGEPDEISFFYGGPIDALETFKVSPP